MELMFIPKTGQNKTFENYRIQGSNTIIKGEINFENIVFYFIGRDKGIVESLLKIFSHGYSVDGIENAKVTLIHALNGEESDVPGVIFFDSHFSFNEIQDISRFLNANPLLSSIPLILDGTHLSEKEWRIHKKAKIVDEIVLIKETSDHHLLSKCRFLRKVKSIGNDFKKEAISQNQFIGKIHFRGVLKRMFDITIAILMLIFLCPVFILVVLAIRIESKGSVFYISKRAGKGYRIFNFIKFRTMKAGADSNIDEYLRLNQYEDCTITGPLFFKICNDPRVTKVGSFLRKTSLDELPQLFNVLRGDMSLVGNRPLPLYEAVTLTTDDCARRFMAPAGITGLWQIKKRGKENMSVKERINLDIDYANKYNFMYDLWIIANTPSALFQKENV